MPSDRTVATVVLIAGLLIPFGARGQEPDRPAPRADDVRSTRVFRLQDMDTKVAVTLLRQHVQVRQIAELGDLGVVIVNDVADRVDRAESLLREHEAVAQAIDPHEPLRFDRRDPSPTETRVFRIQGLDIKAAVVVLRSIYQIRAVTEREANRSVTVTAPASRLEAIEALLRELGVLADEGSPS